MMFRSRVLPCLFGVALMIVSSLEVCGSSTIYETSFSTPDGDPLSLSELQTQGWSFNSTNGGHIRVGGIGGHSNALIMDSGSDGHHSSLNEAILTLDLSDWWNVGLDFSEFDANDEEDPLPLSFNGSYNGDGVSIGDGDGTWYTVWTPTYDHDNWVYSHWFDLEPFIVANNLNRGNIQLKFQQWDNSRIPYDGRAYDNILVRGVFHGGGDAVVPEPASLSLLGLGGMLLAGYRLRRKRNKDGCQSVC